MTVSLLESELLFLNSEEGAYELEGDIASTTLPTSLSESIRLRLAKVRARHPHTATGGNMGSLRGTAHAAKLQW